MQGHRNMQLCLMWLCLDMLLCVTAVCDSLSICDRGSKRDARSNLKSVNVQLRAMNPALVHMVSMQTQSRYCIKDLHSAEHKKWSI